jgi:hypothetical protein
MKFLLSLTLLLLSSYAIAAPNSSPLQGSRIEAPPHLIQAGTNTGSRILYLNRCVGGCVIEPGFEDSRTNHSSIVETTRNISEFRHSDEDWQYIVDCVRELYAPFDVLVTDEDPGDISHSEAIVAGTAVEAGFLGAGGVAPFACSFIDNAITYTFAGNYENMRTICNVVGQESAHAFGLDHEMECKDPLTYLGGCSLKSFQDVDAPCGEYVERECECGGDTQNSFRYLEDLFGPGFPPTVQIESPRPEERVDIGFQIRATGIDDGLVTRSELWIDEVLVDSLDKAPFEYQAPTTLRPGAHEIEVRIFDDRHQFGSQTITIEQDLCTSRNQCGFSYLCLGGQCVLGPGNQGGLGELCQESEDCQSLVCARDRNLPEVCAAFCDLDPQSCPQNYECVTSTEGMRVCMPDLPRGGGGFCSSSGAGTRGGWAVFLLCLLCGTRRHHGKGRNRRPQG